MQLLNELQLKCLDWGVGCNNDAFGFTRFEQLPIKSIIVVFLETIVLKCVHRLAHNCTELFAQNRPRELKQCGRDNLHHALKWKIVHLINPLHFVKSVSHLLLYLLLIPTWVTSCFPSASIRHNRGPTTVVLPAPIIIWWQQLRLLDTLRMILVTSDTCVHRPAKERQLYTVRCCFTYVRVSSISKDDHHSK